MAEISLDSVCFVGERLSRPECVLTTRHGDIFASDSRGGIFHRRADHSSRIYAGASLDLRGPLLPNGFALNRDGSFIVAHLSLDTGGVYRLDRVGQVAPILQQIDGADLTVTNFVLLDDKGRLWITIATRTRPRTAAFRPGVEDGYVILMDHKGPRIVADGIGFANEVRLNPAGNALYVVETYARCLTRFDVSEDGELSNRETIAEFEPGEFPDGLALDSEGAVWVTCIVANRLVRIERNGRRKVMLDDSDDAYCREVEAAYRAGKMDKAHIDRVTSKKLANISSLAFGGDDLRTIYLGVLLGDRLPSCRSPVAGSPMVHWDWS